MVWSAPSTKVGRGLASTIWASRNSESSQICIEKGDIAFISSRGPNLAEEIVDLAAQLLRFAAQRSRRGEHGGGGRAGVSGGLGHADHAVRQFAATGRGFLHVAGDFPGGGVLLL